ncbi:ribosomal oxygenase 1 isoform X2 [Poecilia reticulata]|uniref:Bifunctional lysine-specific demethylase and histidyl-hydroxylase n=1 Tax=Poecilia reticulata TaxID=8081 RepID=A0A3P9NUY6_POERE|nr:PREDICTED: bifunctional lysine-specific demethylase and histidyl-hydroxylase NO66-like isoform X2 [Poecilia reticulata]
MENKHMSAFSLYQSLQSELPPPLKKPCQRVQVEVKKKKKKVNGSAAAIVNQQRAKRRKIRKKLEKAAKKQESKKNGLDNTQQKEESVTAESLDALLTELTSVNNSKERANKLFQWLLKPVPAKFFFRETWEKKPVYVQRKNPDYYKGLFSTAEFDRILRKENVQYGVNLDITSYVNGKRETHNPPGRALPFTVWDFYESGCSVRLLNPQAFSSTVWSVLSILQEKFDSMAGANVYLTPPGTQGFAPHYDDIEAFVIQLEGKKHWRVYSPRSEDEVLPVLSSPNFDQAEIGKPILDVVLEAGDLLFFPRGFIHQGNCLPDAHSLHITISSYQKNSWGDLLQKVIPAALEVAMEEDVDFRRGLPLNYLTYMGVQNSDKEDPRRAFFLSRVEKLIKKLPNFAPVDAAVDQKAKEFFHDCLPPVLTPDELATSVHGAPARWENGKVKNVGVHITTQTKIRLLRAGCARLCSDGDAVHLCYTVDNSRVYHKEEPKSFEIQTEHTDAVEFLIHSYPNFVTVGNLPCDFVQDKIALAELLFEKGIIHTSEPLEAPPAVESE